MPIYEFYIAVADEEDLPSGHKRKKEGDVIAVRPYPWNWGRKEIDAGLIVIMERSETLDELRAMIETSLYEGDRTQADIDQMTALEGEPLPKQIAKRRFKIPLDTLKLAYPGLDLEKVRDKSCIYQPFKSVSQLVQKFDGKSGNYSLTTKDVDTGVLAEEEIALSGVELTEKTEEMISGVESKTTE